MCIPHGLARPSPCSIFIVFAIYLYTSFFYYLSFTPISTKAPHFRQAMRDYDYFGREEKNVEGEESVCWV